MYMLEDLQRYLRYYDSNVTRFRNKLSIFCISVSNLAFHHFKKYNLEVIINFSAFSVYYVFVFYAIKPSHLLF